MQESKITLEQVEQLRQAVKVSYEQAKAALEATGGDLLDAMIWLEQMGKLETPGVAVYSTQEGQSTQQEQSAQSRQQRTQEEPELFRFGRRIRRWMVDNRLEAYRPGGNEIQVPIGVAIILLILSFWFVAILLVVGYIFGWRFRFAGPDLSREDVNQVMEGINDTADGVVNNVKDSWNNRAKH